MDKFEDISAFDRVELLRALWDAQKNAMFFEMITKEDPTIKIEPPTLYFGVILWSNTLE